MHLRYLRLIIIGLAGIMIATACQSQITPPPVDTIATAVAQAASDLLTQTAVASSPTPPPPTITITPSPTETGTATPTLSGPPRLPQTVTEGAGCFFGPGPTYTLETHLHKGKGVQLLGVGSVPGWYIIRDPYFHRPCWISVNDLKIFPGTDPSTFPVMTPGTPLMGE